MQGWPGGPPSLARLNPIYSEAEETGAGRSKASSSGYGSQRGSGGGSVSDRPVQHSEDPYTIYSTCSVRDDEYATTKKYDIINQPGRYLPKVTRAHPGKAEFFARINEGFVEEEDGYKSDLGNDEYNKKDYDSLQADPFLLYSQFIKQEEEKAKGNESKAVSPIRVEDANIQNTSRDEYLSALLQDVALAIDEAFSARRLDSQGGFLKEARERLAVGLVALRQGPQDLKDLSRALSRGPPRPLPRPAPPASPSPHSLKPSLWQRYYKKGSSSASQISGSDLTYYNSPIRPELLFTLGVAEQSRLEGKLKSDRKAKCMCRATFAFLALAFFLAAIVICSKLLSGGRAMFGSMMR